VDCFDIRVGEREEFERVAAGTAAELGDCDGRGCAGNRRDGGEEGTGAGQEGRKAVVVEGLEDVSVRIIDLGLLADNVKFAFLKGNREILCEQSYKDGKGYKQS